MPVMEGVFSHAKAAHQRITAEPNDLILCKFQEKFETEGRIIESVHFLRKRGTTKMDAKDLFDVSDFTQATFIVKFVSKNRKRKGGKNKKEISSSRPTFVANDQVHTSDIPATAITNEDQESTEIPSTSQPVSTSEDLHAPDPMNQTASNTVNTDGQSTSEANPSIVSNVPINNEKRTPTTGENPFMMQPSVKTSAKKNRREPSIPAIDSQSTSTPPAKKLKVTPLSTGQRTPHGSPPSTPATYDLESSGTPLNVNLPSERLNRPEESDINKWSGRIKQKGTGNSIEQVAKKKKTSYAISNSHFAPPPVTAPSVISPPITDSSVTNPPVASPPTDVPSARPSVTSPPAPNTLVTSPPTDVPSARPSVISPPVTPPSVTSPPAPNTLVTSPPFAVPSVASPPVTSAPATPPSVASTIRATTDVPFARPSVTTPPVTPPPAPNPSVISPPVTLPSVTSPPTTDVPSARPSVISPPVTPPSVTSPPAPNASVISPPVTPPSVASTIRATTPLATPPINNGQNPYDMIETLQTHISHLQNKIVTINSGLASYGLTSDSDGNVVPLSYHEELLQNPRNPQMSKRVNHSRPQNFQNNPRPQNYQNNSRPQNYQNNPRPQNYQNNSRTEEYSKSDSYQQGPTRRYGY